jgi:hypothetical protein
MLQYMVAKLQAFKPCSQKSCVKLMENSETFFLNFRKNRREITFFKKLKYEILKFYSTWLPSYRPSYRTRLVDFMDFQVFSKMYEKYVSPYCRYYGTINKCYNPHYSHTLVLCGGAAEVKSVDFLHLVWKSVCSIPMEDMIGELIFMS